MLPCPTSDDAVAAALGAASAAGGGTVFFPRGRYFLSNALVVPPNTLLAGEAAGLTSVWFSEANATTAPKVYIGLNDTAAATGRQAPCTGAAGPNSGLASWGLANFTLYITAFHNEVIYISNKTEGFIMSGMRLRINPFVFTWGPYQASRDRLPAWNISNLGNVMDIHGVNNRITDNDIWGAAMLMNSCLNNNLPDGANNWPNFRRGHAYSYIARNLLWNGQASHFMQLWRQVIFEQNVIIGATTAAGGQSLGTGPMGGMAQHIYHADNRVQFTWGGDREVMTYDDAGGSYYGPVASITPGPNGTSVLTLEHDAWPASDWEMGGWYGGQVYVINGTGQTQIRRVIKPGVGVTPSPSNRTWTIASPFDAPLDLGPNGSYVEIMPFRGRNIFHRDYNIDTGPFQFYGHGVQNLVTDVKFERIRGMMGWGQWRGWVPPPPPNNTAFWDAWGAGAGIAGGGDTDDVAIADSSSQQDVKQLGGAMGNGLQPNVQNIHRGVTFVEGNHQTNYNCNQSGYVEWWDGKSVVLYPVDALNPAYAVSPHPVHIGSIYRGTTVNSNGGFYVGMGAIDVVIEGSVVNASDGDCIEVLNGRALVYVADDNTCS